VKRGRQIDGEDGVPAIDGKALGGRDVLDAGVVDEDIDRAEALFGIADQLCALLGIGKVGRVEENLDAVLLAQTPGKRLGLFRRDNTVDDETASGGGEGSCHAETDPRGGSGDDGGRVAQIHAGCASRAGGHRAAKSSMRLATRVEPRSPRIMV